MRQNFGRDKKRLEEIRRKRREEKRNKKLNKNTGSIASEVPPESALPEKQ